MVFPLGEDHDTFASKHDERHQDDRIEDNSQGSKGS
jgi:hypothetical protein